jgi:acetyl esterase/lipase
MLTNMPEPGRVSVETVVVGRGGDRDLQADLYRPPAPNGSGVLLVHGGSFIHGDRTQLRGYGILLGRAGYTCLACEYRLAPASKWPAQVDDVNTALTYLHAQAPALGLDRSKIAVSGNSAGGQLSLMAAALQVAPVAAAVAFYPPTDFLGPGARALGAPDAMQYLVGDDVSEAKMESISPANFVTADFPPTMLVTGNNDVVVDWRDSQLMYQRLVDAGARAELHVFEGAPHAFDALPSFGRQCAGLVSLFLDRTVLDPKPIVVPTAPE